MKKSRRKLRQDTPSGNIKEGKLVGFREISQDPQAAHQVADGLAHLCPSPEILFG